MTYGVADCPGCQALRDYITALGEELVRVGANLARLDEQLDELAPCYGTHLFSSAGACVRCGQAQQENT